MQQLLPTMEPSQQDLYEMAIAQPLPEKVQQAITLFQKHEPPEGYYIAYSGGKDSGCILELANLADVKIRPHYNVTTLDPPELVRFIKREHSEVIWNRPKKALLTMIADDSSYGPPTRLARWCCKEYKEQGGNGQFKVLGVRAPESRRRKLTWKRLLLNRNGGRILCPILYWTDDDVWQFHREQNIPYCELYDQGFKRLGCVGCPAAGPKSQRRDFNRWPGFEKAWRRAFRRYWNNWRGVPMQHPRWESYNPATGPHRLATEFRTCPAEEDDVERYPWVHKVGELMKQQLRWWYWFEDFGDPDTLFEWWVSGGKKHKPQAKCQELNLYS